MGISPQNFLNFNFNPTGVKFVPSANPKLLNLNQDHHPQLPPPPTTNPQKAIFLVKSL